MLSAKDVAEHSCSVGERKVDKENYKVILSGAFAGMFIAFGYFAYIIIAGGTYNLGAGSAFEIIIGRFLGAFLFPVGIILIVLTGVDLFTGNCLITLGWLKGCYKGSKVIKNLTLVFVGNFIGALLFVLFLHLSNMVGETSHYYILKLANTKVNLTFTEALFRGILCNIIVSVSVYGSYAAKDAVGKIFALLFPIALFVVGGFEHSVANMFILPLGILEGADYTVIEMLFKNILPVTLGNVIGGAILVPLGLKALFVTRISK